jgi:hypothetical protein
MIRGTTPTHIFKLPFSVDICKQIKIIYAQDDVILLEKTAEHCELNDNAATVTLTQEETFKFNCRKPVQIQVRVLTQDGDALNSGIKLVSVEKCLDDEVLE